MSGPLLWIVVAAVVVLVVGLMLYLAGRARAGRTTASLRRQFGPEYERVVERFGGRRRGEAELRARMQRRSQLSIRTLEPEERRRYSEAWEAAQSSFVTTPIAGLRDADLLVMESMRDRGYPVEHFEERAKLVSVDHPELVEHFRSAHAVAVSNEQESADTEQLRQAMVNYRYVFDELVGGGNPDASTQELGSGR